MTDFKIRSPKLRYKSKLKTFYNEESIISFEKVECIDILLNDEHSLLYTVHTLNRYDCFNCPKQLKAYKQYLGIPTDEP